MAYFDPFGEPSWLEPIQSFLLYWEAWPRHDGGGNIAWFQEGDDSRPDEIARWRVQGFSEGTTIGTLDMRRDRLMAFLSTFEYDLAIYYEENVEAVELENGWVDEDREENRYWRCWATAVHPGTRAVLRAVTLMERPAYEDVAEPRERTLLEFVIGSDEQGQAVAESSPPGEFLTPVFFREEVLERYYQDPRTFTVENDLVRGGRQWILPIARTDRGTIQAWLGDVNGLPISVQQHWQIFAVPDEGVPEWRLRRDFLAQFVDPPEEGPIARLKDSIRKANDSCLATYGQPLFADVEPAHADSVRTMRMPANSSMQSFLEQVRTVALLVIDYLNSRLLDAARAPADAKGPINRLAALVSVLSGDDLPQARDRIAGLYAVQSVRSNVVSHRTGPKADQALAKAGINKLDLASGFLRLVEGASQSIDNVRELIDNASSVEA